MSDHEDEDSLQRHDPIPEVLHSFYQGRAFVSCTRFGEALADFEDGYRVSKNFKRGEVLIEYALCMPCLNAMLEEASEESTQRLAEFQAARFRDVSGFDECALCPRTRVESRNDEFGLVGVCQGDHLLDSALICIDCMEEMHEVLSEQTRKTWDRFRQENFPGVPSDFEPFPPRPRPKIVNS